MKIKGTIILVIIATVFTMTSCKKSTHPFIGDYTYQTSGEISVEIASKTVEIPLQLMGQMQILKEKEAGKVLVIRKSIMGDITKIEGTINGKEIELEEHTIEEELLIPLDSLTIEGKAKIIVKSKGKIYDNTIVFDESYSGYFYEKGSSAAGLIVGKDITTVAKKND